MDAGSLDMCPLDITMIVDCIYLNGQTIPDTLAHIHSHGDSTPHYITVTNGMFGRDPSL